MHNLHTNIGFGVFITIELRVTFIKCGITVT